MNTERLGHTGPIGMAISAARPASPVDSTIKPINVLSEPHENCRTSTEGGSPSACAATRLQQTLEKSDTRAYSDANADSVELDQLEFRHQSVASGSSIRIATTAAREVVAGLFNRRKQSLNSLSDSRTSALSRSPTSSLSLTSAPTTDSDEDYLYTEASCLPPLCSPKRRKNKDKNVSSSRTAHHEPGSLGNGYANFPTFGPSSTVKKGPPIMLIGEVQAGGAEAIESYRGCPYSSFTLTQNRFDNKVQKRVVIGGKKSLAPEPRVSLQDVFMKNTNNQTPPRRTRRNTENQGDFRSPVGALIRQSSVCRSISSVNEAAPFREGSVHSSGTAALTSVLTSPSFDRRNKITSLSPPGNYRLPDSDGYVSFPPYVPSYYNRSSLAHIFGCNGTSASLSVDVDESGNRPQEEGGVKPKLGRTLRYLVPHSRNNSFSTQSTTLSEVE